MNDTAGSPTLRIKRAGLPDDVYEILLAELSWGNLEAGSTLSIDGLSRRLGVSQTPVREALARLEATGLVSRQARQGYRVAPPLTDGQMLELLEVRRLLEAEALRKAMKDPLALEKDLVAALRNHERSQRAYEKPHSANSDRQLTREYSINDWSFHQAILDRCGNSYLVQAVNGLSFQVHRMRQRLGHAPLAVAEHRVILDAVRDRDVEAAVLAMDQHLDAVCERIGRLAQN